MDGLTRWNEHTGETGVSPVDLFSVSNDPLATEGGYQSLTKYVGSWELS